MLLPVVYINYLSFFELRQDPADVIFLHKLIRGIISFLELLSHPMLRSPEEHLVLVTGLSTDGKACTIYMVRKWTRLMTS